MSEQTRSNLRVFFLMLAGIALNLGLNRLIGQTGLPFFFDTIGTIIVSAFSSYVPGITVAIATNLIASIGAPTTAYYGILNVLIAVVTVMFRKRGYFKKWTMILLYVIIIAFIGGVLGGIITWIADGTAVGGFNGEMVNTFAGYGIPLFPANLITAFIVDLGDKAISTAIALLIYLNVPDSIKQKFKFRGWKQNPLYDDDLYAINHTECRRASLGMRIVVVIMAACLAIAIVITYISFMLFRQTTIDEHAKNAKGITGIVSDAIDPDKIDDYIKNGEKAPGYKETEDLLYKIRDNTPDVLYLYVYRIENDGCHVVFDLDTKETPGGNPGDIVPFDESFNPLLPTLLAGDRIEPIITNDTFGYLLTVYEPIYDKKGNCKAYACADISMVDLNFYQTDFIMKLLSLGFSFLILILSFALWLARYNIIYPVNSMAFITGKFEYHDKNALEKNEHTLNTLQIETGDELENLYHAFSEAIQNSAKFYNDMQAQADAFAELQNGLIMVLADMVENRDSSTGEHVRKTAAYTGIIMEELRRTGHFTDVLTDEYISNVIKSAPLHDIGKISVSDNILNKPGKLTDEEFDIMKTHTTAGAEIIEKVISKLPDSDYLEEAENIAHYHHEKWNGRGYPEGLAGEDIPLSARIMAVADVFDALVSPRVYKKAFTYEKAFSIIQEDAGSHFDPVVAEAFINVKEEAEAIANDFAKQYTADPSAAAVKIDGKVEMVDENNDSKRSK